MYKNTLTQLSQLLAQKACSSVELTQHFLSRIAQYDKQWNSFVTVTPELALQAAKAADQKRAQGETGPLLGIPIAHKDILCTTGIKTSCGSKMLDNFISPYDATLVTQLKNAGTVILGKTNMDEFAMGSSNENSFYGPVCNPWDVERVPGGSSGGSAAAVAGRLAPATTGTDTGGSIRQPAAFCNITGLKPTYGRVSRYGLVAYASSLDQAGPMAYTAEDAALLLNAMAGFDPKDSTSMDLPVPDYTATLRNSLSGRTIGIPRNFFDARLDTRIADLLMTACRLFEKLGATIKDISLPNTDLSIPVYYVVAPSECASNLARFDGVRYGYRCNNPRDLRDLYERSRGEGFGAEVKRRIMIGTYALSAGYFDAYYLKAQKIRHLIADDFTQAFKTVDMIFTPTTPTLPFKLGEKTQDPISMYLSDIYTIAINLAGLPAISLPAGFIDNLPVGMQLIGPHFSEALLLNAGHQYQSETDWHTRMPHNIGDK